MSRWLGELGERKMFSPPGVPRYNAAVERSSARWRRGPTGSRPARAGRKVDFGQSGSSRRCDRACHLLPPRCRMQLSSVRELKSLLAGTVLAPLSTGGVLKAFAVSAGPLERAAAPGPSIALGVTRTAANDYKLAVRVQRRELETSRELDTIRRQARNEVDVRYIGVATKAAEPPWTQR